MDLSSLQLLMKLISEYVLIFGWVLSHERESFGKITKYIRNFKPGTCQFAPGFLRNHFDMYV